MIVNNTDWIKCIVAACGGILAYLWGPWDALIIALIVCMAIDYLTGVIKAWCNKELSSTIGFKGLGKKVIIFGLVALATMIDRIVPAANQAIRAAVIMFYIANEGLSILENAGALGLPMPKALKSALKALRKDAGEDDVESEEPPAISENKEE